MIVMERKHNFDFNPNGISNSLRKKSERRSRKLLIRPNSKGQEFEFYGTFFEGIINKIET